MVSNPSTKVKTEAIDEVILRLLGLKPGVEIDYQTYFEILKKKLAIARLAGKELPREEDELLREELKRVRRVKDKGIRIKIKEAKTKVASVGVGPGVSSGGVGPKSGAIVKAKTTKITSQNIVSVNVKDVTEKKEERVSRFDGIKKTLDSILEILSSKLKFDKKQSETDRKEKETQRRTKREEGLEGFKKGISAVSGAAKKMLAPFQSIIDRIWRFIFFTLLGRAFTQLMEWLGDPKNKKKIESLGRFLKDWWPALAFAAGLFLTPFGKFIRTTITLLRGFIPQILKIIPRLTAFAAANPGTIPIVAATIGGVAKIKESERMKPLTQESQKEIDKTLKSKDAPWYQKLGSFFAGQSLNAPGGPVNPIGLPSPGAGFASGGVIPRFTMGGMNPKVFDTGYEGIDGSTGQRVSGFGPDTQQIIAQPGEIVINKPTVDAVGADHFLGLNRMYGGPGANKPKMGRIQTATAGGMVLQKFQSGGMVGMSYPSGTPQFGEMPLIRAALSAGIKGRELAALLAQTSHETGGFKWDRELGRGKGMGYSGGDAYHGRGYIQLTHDYNYKKFGDKVGVDLLSNPDLLLSKPDLAAKATIDYWKTRVRPNVTDWNDAFQVSRAVNNPSATKPSQINHYDDRVKRQQYYTPIINTLINKYSPKPKTDPKVNKQKLIDKRPWWDKFGWFGGASRMIQKKQGGGEVEALERTYKQGQKSGMSSEVLQTIGDEAFLLKHFGPGGVWRHFKGSGVTDYRGNIIPKKEGGGAFSRKITESTGLDIPGATADRQLVALALQPGESQYIIPKDSVLNGAIPLFDKVVAMTDPDSNPAKLGERSKGIPNITPLPRGGAGMGGMITLPPITQSASGVGNVGNSSGAGSRAPVFSTVSASGMRQQQENASMYGIVG
jgi:predicted chitinase